MRVDNSQFDCFLMSLFCVWCGAAITAPYQCCCRDKVYHFPSVRIGTSLMEWIILIVFGILIDNKSSYLLKSEHCLYFFISSLIFYVIFTLYPYLMPDLRLPADIPIRSMHGYAFFGAQAELERLNTNVNNNFWDKPADDLKFLQQHFNTGLANAFSRLGYHSGVLMQLNYKEVDLLYDKICRFDPLLHKVYTRSDAQIDLKLYQENVKRYQLTSNNMNKLAAIFALSNKQYETLKWLESNGAKQHILLFKNTCTLGDVSYKKMGFEWARMVLRKSYIDHVHEIDEKYEF